MWEQGGSSVGTRCSHLPPIRSHLVPSFSSHPVPTLFAACSHPVRTLFPPYPHPVPACSQLVPSLFPSCFRPVPILFPLCSHPVSTMFPSCSQLVPTLCQPCSRAVPSLFPPGDGGQSRNSIELTNSIKAPRDRLVELERKAAQQRRTGSSASSVSKGVFPLRLWIECFENTVPSRACLDSLAVMLGRV